MERSIFTGFQDPGVLLKIMLKQIKCNIQGNLQLSVKCHGVVTKRLVRSCLEGT